jgi:hypothetical protein
VHRMLFQWTSQELEELGVGMLRAVLKAIGRGRSVRSPKQKWEEGTVGWYILLVEDYLM